jgi:DNA invertase Pin-like site-specific DNA recombinase
MKLCSYYRVSSEDTATEKFAVQKYRQKALDYGVPEEYIFFDFASGGTSQRKGYQKVIELIKSGERDQIVVPMQSRLNRNLLNSELLAEDLAKAGAKLTVLETGTTLDLSCPTDRLVYQLRAIFDHQYLSQCTLTSRDNAEQMRKERRVARVPWGWVAVRGKPLRDEEPYLCLVEDRRVLSPADILRHLIELVISYKSVRKACHEINAYYGVPDYLEGEISSKVRRTKQFDFNKDTRFKHRQRLRFGYEQTKDILSNPLIVGDLQYFSRDKSRETIIIHDAYPDAAFLTRHEFNVLQASIGRKTYPGKEVHNYPLSGLIFCGICGGKCYMDCGGKRGGKQRIVYYLCKNRKHGCPTKRIQAQKIEEVLVDKLTAKYIAISNLAQVSEENAESPEIRKLEIQIEQLGNMADNEPIRRAIAETRKEIEQLKEAERLGSAVKEQNVELLQRIFANPLYWETLGNLEKREIYRLLVKKILIGCGERTSAVLGFAQTSTLFKKGKSYVERVDLLV